MSAIYPNFDAEWRTEDAAARAAQSTLEALVANLEGPSAAAVRFAVQELTQKSSACQKLSEQINAHYKRSKKDCIELQPLVAAVEKCKQEKSHAVTKAKEYRSQVKMLENTVTDLGGKVPDVKKIAAKSLKRGIEEVETEQHYMTLMRYPQKRNKVNDSVEELSKDTHTHSRAAPASPSQIPTPSQSSTESPPPSTDSLPNRKSPPFLHHLEPIPRAKRSNFSKNIPLGTENKFASTRLTQPNRLMDPTQSSSHVTAAIQSLSATLKPHEMWADIPASSKLAPEFRLLRNSCTIAELDDEVSKQKTMPASKAVLDFVAATQLPRTRPLNVYPLQRHLTTPSSSHIDDPVTYMQHVLSSASTPSLKHTFTQPLTHAIFCPTCNHQTGYDVTTEDAWITHLPPTFSEREMRYAKAAPRSLGDMLWARKTAEEYTTCETCTSKDVIVKKTWMGWSYAPQNLVLAFERPAEAKMYKLTLPLEQDFRYYVEASGEKTRYRLVTVVKKLNSGMYAAFVHAEDGKWYRCINDVVRECKIGEWQGDERNGETVLAMYEQLDA